MKPLPRLERVAGQPRLMVDDRPFLILGLQWGCDSCFSREEMNPLFPHAARLGANTAALPTYWREVEPEPDRFDFSMVAERIAQAREHNLRLILLWFATWKNASNVYAPDYIRADPERYPVAVDQAGNPTISPCPNAESTWERDRNALAALMTHLRESDSERTVISVQIENEPGLLRTDRCYCPTCTDLFVGGDYAAGYRAFAAESFSTIAIAGYIDRLAAAARAIYPIPLQTNVWLARYPGAIAGREYPSGGAVPSMLALFKRHTPNLDVVAPDIYVVGYRDFRRFCQAFRLDDNPLYIAETASGPHGRAERNVFYAIGEHGAIGFDPWAIDEDPAKFGTPLVDPIGGEWGPQAVWLRDSYVAISRAIGPIVEAQGTDRLFTLVQEPGETATAWSADGVDLLVSYHQPEGRGRGFLIQRGPDEFLIIGVDFDVRFRHPRPDGSPRHVIRSDYGRFDGEEWITLHPMRRERHEREGHHVEALEPGVVRVLLAPR